MAPIAPNTTGPNAQLAGIQASVPQPVPTTSPAPAGGSHFTIAPTFQATLGGENGGIVSPLATAPPLVGASGASSAAGGGAAPAFGAQPSSPGAAANTGAPGTTVATAGSIPPATAGTTVVASSVVAPATTAISATAGPGLSTPALTPTSALTAAPAVDAGVAGRAAVALTGFGKAERSQPMKVSVNGAEFGFPSFQASAKSTAAPAISWGTGWKRVEADGMWYMEHSNGAKAIPAIEYRVTPAPADKVSTVKVANGWGKKFPDGTVLVFDRNEGAYRLDSNGAKHKVPLGTHTFGGVKVRVFEASVVRTLESNGAVTVFDSRGNHGAGTTRGSMAAALAGANAGASVSGGGKAGTDSGGAVSGKPGTIVAAGGATASTPTAGQLTGDVQRLTGVARGLLDQIRSGNVDAAGLAALQAQLGTLPAGILQAAGAAGTISSDGSVLRHAVSPPASSPPAAGTIIANTSGGGGSASPIAGADANSATKQAAAGTKAHLAIAVPAAMVGKQARFGQLPSEVQAAIATALGSTEGAGALKADQLVAFTAGGDVSLVEPGSIYVRHVPQVRGAGPGEELALTVRPTRQPGSTGSVSSVVTAPGGATSSNASMSMSPTASGGGVSAAAAPQPAMLTTVPRPATPMGTTVVAGGITNPANRIPLFTSGQSIRSVDLGGVNGSFTWATLPAKAKTAILDFLKTQTSDPAAKAYASRTGSGWAFDPNAVIVVDAGFASFVAGMAMTRSTPTGVVGGGAPAAPSAGSGSSALGHDATRPPVSGGGGRGIGSVPPGTAPPVPAVGGTSHAHSAGVSGMHM